MADKVEDGIIGLAVGDALGVPVEFQSREKLEKNPVTEMQGYGSHNVPEGTWSDDTSLTVAEMDSIIENYGAINYNDIMTKFSEWVKYAKYTATDQFFDIGIATSTAITNYRQGDNPINCGVKGIRQNGNGSLMRILPFVYYAKANNYSEDERIKLINDASSITHAHEISRLGCVIFTDYVNLLLDGMDKKEALRNVKEINYGEYYSEETLKYYERILKGNIEKLPKDAISSSGFIVSSLEASLWCTLNTDNYESAVEQAVNLGNDTDTIGAITGGINGIIYGKKAIPQRWLTKLKKKEYLENLSKQFTNTITKKNRLNEIFQNGIEITDEENKTYNSK